MRRAAKIDTSQQPIIDALKRVSVSVEIIGKPLDLLLNARFFCPHCSAEIEGGRTGLMECKSERPTSEGGSNGLTKDQVEFIDRWPGKLWVARSPEEAVRLVLGERVMA